MFFFPLQCSDAPSTEAERIKRFSDNAGDKHLAHIFCLSNRCHITARSITAAPLTATFAATDASLVFAVFVAGSEYFCTSLESTQQPLNIHLLCFCLKAVKHFQFYLLWISEFTEFGRAVVNVFLVVWKYIIHILWYISADTTVYHHNKL